MSIRNRTRLLTRTSRSGSKPPGNSSPRRCDRGKGFTGHDKGFVTGFGLGAIATLVAVAILSIELSAATLERFREARNEERIVVAIKEWSRGYPIEIDHLDVKRKAGKFMVDIGLIADVPGSFSDQVVAPRQMFPEHLHRDELFDAIEKILRA